MNLDRIVNASASKKQRKKGLKSTRKRKGIHPEDEIYKSFNN